MDVGSKFNLEDAGGEDQQLTHLGAALGEQDSVKPSPALLLFLHASTSTEFNVQPFWVSYSCPAVIQKFVCQVALGREVATASIARLEGGRALSLGV